MGGRSAGRRAFDLKRRLPLRRPISAMSAGRTALRNLSLIPTVSRDLGTQRCQLLEDLIDLELAPPVCEVLDMPCVTQN